MARILGLWFWLTTAAVLAVLIVWFADYLSAAANNLSNWSDFLLSLVSPRLVGVLVGAAIMATLTKPVWTRLWRIERFGLGRLLRNHIFEDLNGEWRVTIESNWPAVSALLQAAKSTEWSYDPVSSPQSIPPNSSSEFSATIDQGWERASIEIRPNEKTPLLQSRTFAFDLIKATADAPQRVFWGFKQTNGALEATDEDNFLGAAHLEVRTSDLLEGVYWNNRSWRSGLNAAGRIKLERISASD
jgi:hypothetical protein